MEKAGKPTLEMGKVSKEMAMVVNITEVLTASTYNWLIDLFELLFPRISTTWPLGIWPGRDSIYSSMHWGNVKTTVLVLWKFWTSQMAPLFGWNWRTGWPGRLITWPCCEPSTMQQSREVPKSFSVSLCTRALFCSKNNLSPSPLTGNSFKATTFRQLIE